jgi:hypothetical protein
MAEDGGYRIGDVANGYVLTEQGWQPLAPGAEPTPPRYRIGDTANGYVLTEQGWQPLGPPAGAPAWGSPQAYAPQPGYGPVQPAYQPNPGTRSRKGLWITVAVVAVVFVGFVAAAVLTLANARRPGGVSAPAVSSSPATTGSPASAPEPTPSDASSSEPASEGKLLAYGETGSLTLDRVDAAEITVAEPVEFTPTNSADHADRGRLVYVPVMIHVVGKVDVPIDPYDFEVVLPDGDHLDVAYVRELPKDAPAQLLAAEVGPGKTVIGSVPFDVPAAVQLKVAYTPDGEVLGTWK